MKNELAAVLTSMLEKLPGVVVGRKLSSTNFTIRKKLFAFTKEGGVALKLPPETAKEAVRTRAASLLLMGKRTMKEWVVIHYKDSADAKMDLGLFKEAMNFVSSKA